MSQRDFSEVEPEGTSELPAASRALFVEKVRLSNAACQAGDYATAVALYSDALTLDPANHILFSNRSAALLKQGQFSAALQDAIRARELCPTWPKAYYRQGVALQCLGRHGEALAAFSSGLAQNAGSRQLLAALVEASLKSPLRPALHPTFMQLQAMKLDQSPFVLISVVGQELLGAGHYHAAVTVLEAALRIGSCSLKLRGSVFSALSSAHWALSQLDKAIGYMQQDLAVAKSLGDTAGECRAHGNLGAAYFSQGSFKEALTAHRYQLVLAMKCKDTQAAAAALTSLGHVYTAIGDYPNALASHKQCVQLVKQMGDRLQEAREIGNVGAVYLAMGEFDSAVDCHTQHLRLARRLGNQVEEARAYSNLGSSHHYRRNFTQAIAYHENVLRIAQSLGDRAVEARAYAGLGHAARCAGDYAQAKRWHERQLDMALAARDKVGEGRACSNLGIVYQLLGEHDAALKLHQAHLSIARSLGDRAGMGRAYGNIGNAYSAAGFYEQAIKYHKQELTISKEVHDRSSEASTHGNLAVAYQALGAHDMALLHYRSHLGIARELKDTAGEACALLNLGNCLSSRQEFAQAVPFYEQYLMLSQELGDVAAEAKACHFLGYAHYCIGNYREAVRYYDQDLSLAKDLQDKMNMGRAYCNLGLAHLALGQLDSSLECQKYFLAIAHMTQHLPGKFRALGNIGDVLIKMGDIEEAVNMYQRQLGFARQARDRGLEASACGALGLGHRLLRRLDKALGYHTQELTLRQEMADISGEARAHGHLGTVHMALGNYTHAVKCYQEQLERAQELQDCAVEAQAFGNLGIARLNMGHYEDAIGYLEQQLATLERLSTPTTQLDKARAFGSLGDCYDALGDPEEAVKCHEQHLALALGTKNTREQERAYRGLGLSHKSLGNLQQALVCLEKRLVVSHELGSSEAKAQAYGELGNIHGSLGNLEQAVSCLEHQRNIARELNDRVMESDAVSSLGVVYQQMGDYATALRYHQMDLENARQLGITQLQGRACGNLGAVHEALGNLEEAVRCQEQHLAHAAAASDRLARAVALGALGRVHHARGAPDQAVAYLRQGLAIAESLGRREEEARIRHRLGVALWACGQAEGARQQLVLADALLVALRGRARQGGPRGTRIASLQAATTRALQTVLVGLGRQQDALVVAENGRSRSLLDLLLEKNAPASTNNNAQACSAGLSGLNRSSTPSPIDTGRERIPEVWSPQNIDQMLEIVNRQKASVLYYSLAAGFLYAWLIVPMKGVVKFHQVAISEDRENNGAPNIGSEESQPPSGSVLEHYIQAWRDSLHMELQKSGGGDGPTWDRGVGGEEPTDRAGFLRMVNRNHLLNSSNYSLSSLFSVGSVGGSVASLQGSTRSSTSLQSSTRSRKISMWQGPSCIQTLYQMLLAPFEDVLPTSCSTTNATHSTKNCGGRRDLVLVLEGDLYLVPFPVLRPGPGHQVPPGAAAPSAPQGPPGAPSAAASSAQGSDITEYLCERFSLIALPSLAALKGHKIARSKVHADSHQQDGGMRCLVVGNPRLPSGVSENWGWQHSSPMQKEALMVGDMLHAHTLTDIQASREAVLAQISEAECIHLSTHVSWKLSAIVLSPGEMVDSQSQGGTKRFLNTSTGSGHSDSIPGEGEEEGSELSSSNMELPPLSEFLLTARDILNLKLSARLVVISCCHNSAPNESSTGAANCGAGGACAGVVKLCRALLAAGAHCVLLSLWPVPDTAAKILLRAFYSALLQGNRAARALGDAMQTVQHTKHFAHPANWAGFTLVGSNVRLSNKVALMGQALTDLLKTPDKCRDALRVSLHLVEKSLQRIVRGQKNAMYTTQKSIENKVGNVTGWKELLMSVGFRFEPAANGIPSSVFFPQSDPEDRLTQCSASLQALLGLTSTTLHALSKLISNVDMADDIIGVIRSVISQFSLKNVETESIEISVSVRLWRVEGCHELLASLGCDLMEVGQDEVTLRTGKQANRRNIQFVLQALLALFDTQEAPRSLSLDSSSSLESLASIENNDMEPHSDGELHRATSSPNLGNIGQSVVPPPPLPLSGPRLTPGAFTSYVRHRGEPDGRTAPPPDAPPRTTTGALDCDLSVTACYGNVSRLPGTATLNMSNKFGASRNDLQHQSYRSTHSKSDFRSGERPPVKISRPGGGGESDAAFTPSPPVALQRHISDQLSAINNPTNVTLALAHQTKIRNLYHATPGSNQTLMGARMMGRQAQNLTDMQMDAYGLNASILDGDIKSYAQAGQMQNQMGVGNSGLRPDSSSSASSATDWESSGHATVLRRAPLPPLPPPRLPPAPGPLVENLHPLPPVYNNLSSLAGAFAEGNSSDSDFERGFEQTLNTAMPLTSQPSGMANLQGRNNIKTLYKNTGTHRKGAQASDASLERLSVRTELSSNIQAVTNAIANMSTTSRKAPALPTSESHLNTPGSIYYSATEQSGPSRNLETNTLKKQTDPESQSVKSKIENIKQSKASKDIALSSSSKSGSSTIQSSSGSGSIQDSILASQLRHINRELTPTISEVYHERSIGLGLAPPLSKLLLNSNGQGGSGNNNSNNDSNMMTGLEKFGIIDENSIPEKDVIGHGNSSQVTRVAAECERFCDMCNRPVEQGSTVCACKNVVNISHKKPSNNSKPWLSGATSLHNNIQGPDLTTAEIIERQTKMKTHNVQEMGTMKSKNQTFADSIANSYSTEMTTIRHELTKTELIERDRRESVIASISAEIQNAGSAIKRAISPFSEMSRRDEGDGRSIADSHSSYNGVVISPQNSTPSCGSRQPMFSNNPSSEESDTMAGSGSSEAVDKQGRMGKSTHPRTKMKQQGVPQKQRSTFNLELIKDNHHCK